MKQETLERAAERNWDEINSQYRNGLNPYAHKVGFIEGAKWQAEQFLHFIKNEDHHTEGELGNSCIDVQTLVNFTKQTSKRMYSEEDLREAFRQGMENMDPDFPENMDYSEMYGWSSKLTEQEWFEQFKKK